MTIRWTIAIYPGSFKTFFYVREIDHAKATFEDRAVSVFLLILSGLKVHMKGKMTLLTSLAKSVGVSSTEQL